MASRSYRAKQTNIVNVSTLFLCIFFGKTKALNVWIIWVAGKSGGVLDFDFFFGLKFFGRVMELYPSHRSYLSVDLVS